MNFSFKLVNIYIIAKYYTGIWHIALIGQVLHSTLVKQ